MKKKSQNVTVEIDNALQGTKPPVSIVVLALIPWLEVIEDSMIVLNVDGEFYDGRIRPGRPGAVQTSPDFLEKKKAKKKRLNWSVDWPDRKE